MDEISRLATGRTISTGLVIRRSTLGGEQFLLAVGAREFWRERDGLLEAPVFGIGGRPEPGESLVECVRREALEEGGFRVRVLDSQTTLHLRRGRAPDRLPLGKGRGPRPCFVWTDDVYRWDLADRRHAIPYLGVVYRGALLDEPRATGDPYCVAWFPLDTLAVGGDRTYVTVEEVVSSGGEIVGSTPPRGTRFQLVGTAAWLERWLTAAGE